MKIVKVTDSNNLIFQASISTLAEFDYRLIIWLNLPCNVKLEGDSLLISNEDSNAEIKFDNLKEYDYHVNTDGEIKSIIFLNNMKTKFIKIIDGYKR